MRASKVKRLRRELYNSDTHRADQQELTELIRKHKDVIQRLRMKFWADRKVIDDLKTTQLELSRMVDNDPEVKQLRAKIVPLQQRVWQRNREFRELKGLYQEMPYKDRAIANKAD